jgi:hypothetical protein
MTKLLPCAEWADTLALKPADLSPDEGAALQQHLATCPGCAATYADYQMLMTRLRALPRPALPPLAPLAPELIAAPDDEDQIDTSYDGVDHHWPLPGAEPTPPPARLPRLWRRGWPQRLSLLAAVLLVAVLVGSLALLLHRSPPGPGGGPGSVFRLRPGWTEIVEYSGTGSQTITGQDIELPRLEGSAYGCVGSGGLRIEISEENYTVPSVFLITDRCSALPPPVVSPATFSFHNTPLGKLDTIKVTANAKTRWFFQFTQPAKQPTLRLGSEWGFETGFSGEGNDSTQGLNEVVQTPYKTWGLVFTCFGTGKGYVQLTPDLGKINIPPCTGLPSLVRVHYPAATILQAAQIMVTGDILYDVEIFGCTNEVACLQH